MASPNDGSDGPPGADGGFGGGDRRPTGDGAVRSVSDRALAFTREHLELAWVPLVTALLAAYLVVSGALTAGYFGSIAEALETGAFDFAANVQRYALRMIALETLVLVAFAALLAPIVAIPPLLVVVVLLGFAAAYFLFPTTYLVVLEDRPVLDAMGRAVDLVQARQPIGFVLQVALTVGACSILLSTLARSSVPGAVTAAILAAPLGLAPNVAVMLKVQSLLDGGTGQAGRSPPFDDSRRVDDARGVDGRARR